MGRLVCLKIDLFSNSFPTHPCQGAESPCREIPLSSRKRLCVGLSVKNVIKVLIFTELHNKNKMELMITNSRDTTIVTA